MPSGRSLRRSTPTYLRTPAEREAGASLLLLGISLHDPISMAIGGVQEQLSGGWWVLGLGEARRPRSLAAGGERDGEIGDGCPKRELKE